MLAWQRIVLLFWRALRSKPDGGLTNILGAIGSKNRVAQLFDLETATNRSIASPITEAAPRNRQMTTTDPNSTNKLAEIDREANHAMYLESFKFSLAAGATATKGLFFINGAALIALISLIGSMATRSNPAQVYPIGEHLNWAIIFFVFGLALAIVTSALTYFAQTEYSDRMWQDIFDNHDQADAHSALGDRFRSCAIVVALLSLSLFLAGCWATYTQFIRLIQG